MTQEEKAKAYDKAVARAREIHRNEDEKRFDMEWLFPELAESEDENFIGCVACIYQDSCSSLQFGQGCTDGKEANRG